MPNNVNQVQINSIANESFVPDILLDGQGVKIGKDQILQTLSMAQQIKTEHVIAGLNLAKQYLPTLMKGIGQKTIEKMAATTVAKGIPIAGIAVSAIFAVKDIFSEDPETQQLRRLQETEQKARERREQQIEDSAIQIADQFATNLSLATYPIIDDFFKQVIIEIEKVSQDFSEQDKANSKVLEQVLQVQQKLELL